MVLCESRAICFLHLCGFAERMSPKYGRVIGDPQMLSHDSQTEFSVSQMAFSFTNGK